MPYGKRRTYRKRSYARKKTGGYRRRRLRIRRPLPGLGSGFPVSKVTRLRYSDTLMMNADSTGAVEVYSFRANGCFDPDYTNGSAGQHQPLGFDQWSALYNEYVVLGAKFTANAIVSAATNYQAPVVVAVKLTDDGTPPTSMNTMLEQGICSFRTFNGQAGLPPQRLTKKFSAKKFFGLKDLKDNKDRYGAVVTADPSDQCYFTLMTGTAGGLNINEDRTVYVQIIIDYIVQFSQPKDLASS